MKIFGVIVFILIVGGLATLIVFEVISLVRKFKEIAKNKKAKSLNNTDDNRKE